MSEEGTRVECELELIPPELTCTDVRNDYATGSQSSSPQPSLDPPLSHPSSPEDKVGGSAKPKRSWLEHEDVLVMALVRKLGKRWDRVADHLPSRSADAIRSHFALTGLHLRLQGLESSQEGRKMLDGIYAGTCADVLETADADDGIQRQGWSEAEDAIIREGVARLGFRWRLIADSLPGRSDSSIRNRWHRLQGGTARRPRKATQSLSVNTIMGMVDGPLLAYSPIGGPAPVQVCLPVDDPRPGAAVLNVQPAVQTQLASVRPQQPAVQLHLVSGRPDCDSDAAGAKRKRSPADGGATPQIVQGAPLPPGAASREPWDTLLDEMGDIETSPRRQLPNDEDADPNTRTPTRDHVASGGATGDVFCPLPTRTMSRPKAFPKLRPASRG